MSERLSLMQDWIPAVWQTECVRNCGAYEVAMWMPGDARRVPQRQPDAGELPHCDPDVLISAYDGPRYTVIHRPSGRRVAAFGYHRHGGIASLWSLTSDEAATQPLTMCACLRALINEAFAAGCHRVECLALVEHSVSIRWLIRIGGMQREGVLQQYGPDRRDRVMLAVCKHKEKTQ